MLRRCDEKGGLAGVRGPNTTVIRELLHDDDIESGQSPHSSFEPNEWSGGAVTPLGVRIYAVGDIHGRADLLRRMFALIDRDMAGAVADAVSPVEVYVGDYIDRGPDSREVIELLIYRRRSPFVRTLLGNHENLLLAACSDVDAAALWWANGGLETLRSYGAPPAELAPDDVTRLAAALIRGRHLSFFESLEDSIDIGDYHFVHAGARPGVPLEEQRLQDRLWIREPFLSSDAPFGRVVVHGHSVTREPAVRGNRIGIDTGAVATGVLTCLVLDGLERRFLVARD